LPLFVCPSSPLPQTFNTWGGYASSPSEGKIYQAGNYFGIMGAVTSATDFTDPTGRNRTCQCVWPIPSYCTVGAYKASNGVLFVTNPVSVSDITDGVSNTIMVGEQSDWGSDPGVAPGQSAGDQWVGGYCNPRSRLELRISSATGHWAGDTNGIVHETPWNGSDPRCCGQSSFSLITLRWPIGTKTRQNFQDGMGHWEGFNKPIQSAHPRGAFALRCDGSAAFLSNDTTWDVVKWLAIRDDGQFTPFD
jgi:hypothetical protein